ncbi:MAG: peptide-methionine (S)-S-oxide reductase MsrA [Planctomycetaceae bacterium]
MWRSTFLSGSRPALACLACLFCVAAGLASLTRAATPALAQDAQTLPSQPNAPGAKPAKPKTEQLVVAGGCFWCTEAVYEELDGVLTVVSGYAGGSPDTANYRAVSTGTTRHAEAIEIVFDPTRITREQLLEVFFDAHDPTQLNRQGPDVGTQYRSAIFYSAPAEKAAAQQIIDRLNADKKFRKPIVTTLEPLEKFFPAEEYHQDYAARNPAAPYVRQSSTPKVIKVRKKYADWLKAKEKDKARNPAN